MEAPYHVAKRPAGAGGRMKGARTSRSASSSICRSCSSRGPCSSCSRGTRSPAPGCSPHPRGEQRSARAPTIHERGAVCVCTSATAVRALVALCRTERAGTVGGLTPARHERCCVQLAVRGMRLMRGLRCSWCVSGCSCAQATCAASTLSARSQERGSGVVQTRSGRSTRVHGRRNSCGVWPRVVAPRASARRIHHTRLGSS
jgi:hypothetical protein